MLSWGKEHEAFRERVREIVAQEITPHIAAWEQACRLPRELFEALGAAGLLKGRVSRGAGGDELDLWYTAILIEELVGCGSVGVAMSVLIHVEPSRRAHYHRSGPGHHIPRYRTVCLRAAFEC